MRVHTEGEHPCSTSTFFDCGWGLADRIVRPPRVRLFPKGRRAVDFAFRAPPEETLYVYMQDYEVDENDEVAEYDAKWRVSLGPDQPFAPPPPTWREHLRSLGHPLDTQDEIERVCREHDLPLDELDVHLNGFGWEDSWDNFTGPQAKAHHLLMRGHQMSTPFDPDSVGWSDTPRWPRAVRRSALMRQGRGTGGA
jgi:hypothetical protein